MSRVLVGREKRRLDGGSFSFVAVPSALSGLGGLDAYACTIAKASQHPHSVLPREAKGCHIRKAKPRDHNMLIGILDDWAFLGAV